jgi:hypothetical protein
LATIRGLRDLKLSCGLRHHVQLGISRRYLRPCSSPILAKPIDFAGHGAIRLALFDATLS